ncbi:MAG: T9SS type A sorting domain-containing protein [Bacteroidales bacterium]|nr:T9SS type A sorting domain-containing protein [Bacteroidales bacterium]
MNQRNYVVKYTLPKGIYIVRIVTPHDTAHKKLVID